jgi:N-acetylmuramoyl-L-alanine amidase
MRRFLPFLAGFLLWAAALPAPAQPFVTPAPNPVRGEKSIQPAPAAASAGDSLGALVQSTATKEAEPVVIDARVGQHGEDTRFVVELSDPVKFHIFTLSNPNRLVIDMPEVLWRLKGPPVPRGSGAVKDYRYGLFRPGDSRFVIDLNGPVRMTEPLILPPQDGYGYRLVLDLFPTTQVAFDKKAGWPAALRARETAAEALASLQPEETVPPPGEAARREATRRKVIVIDPGHGGIDSGTIGVTGMEEKNVVLSVGLRLARILRADGYTVYMTRDSDVYPSLYGRAPFARRHNADLFISLHADSNPRRKVRGASIYTLSERGSDKEAAALARKENASDIIAGVDLSGQESSVAKSILISLQQRSVINRSVHFAQRALHDLSGVTDILTPQPHRSANFVVLRSPSFPAVLIELGYLSNPHDCRQMATSRWRSGAARAIASAVRQFEPLASATTRAERN